MNLEQKQKTAQKIGLMVLLLVVLFIISTVFIYFKFAKSDSEVAGESRQEEFSTSENNNQSESENTSSWSESEKEALAKFLAEQNAVLYYGEGCPHCSNQLELFAPAQEVLKKVDCYAEENIQICEQAEISGVPTWVYNGEKKEGVRGLDELAEWVRFNK